MRIKLRQVEGFLAAADTLTFSRAADLFRRMLLAEHATVATRR
ncbi:hypothetical protein [Burkholderia sp. L27(2015)]|nr:hypothetical protein [Burkholderia sp. L27(2015)]